MHAEVDCGTDVRPDAIDVYLSTEEGHDLGAGFRNIFYFA